MSSVDRIIITNDNVAIIVILQSLNKSGKPMEFVKRLIKIGITINPKYHLFNNLPILFVYCFCNQTQ